VPFAEPVFAVASVFGPEESASWVGSAVVEAASGAEVAVAVVVAASASP